MYVPRHIHQSLQLQQQLLNPWNSWTRPYACHRLACRASAAAAAQHLVFPHRDTFTVDQRPVHFTQIIDMLAPSVTPERLQKLQQVINSRSYHVLPVVEGLYDMGNLAAVCRSADAMGCGAVHCIMRPSDKYKKSQRTAAGADKWLDTRLWDSTSDCLGSLKAAGYQVVVTHLSESSITIQEVDWTRPTAFVLGNEKSGVSDTAVSLADHTAVIPMAGFVESFNISVAAALILYEAQQQRLRKLGRTGDLDEKQQQLLLAEFLLRSGKHSRMMVEQLLHRPPPRHQKRFFRHQDAHSSGAEAEDGVQLAAAAAPAGEHGLLTAAAQQAAAEDTLQDAHSSGAEAEDGVQSAAAAAAAGEHNLLAAAALQAAAEDTLQQPATATAALHQHPQDAAAPAA